METIAAMRILIRVVQTGGFSSAARQLGVAPSSVSRQINELEQDLGVRLFQRTTRRLNLTEAGHTYYQHAQQIITQVDEARLAVTETSAPSGILRVAVPSGMGRSLIVATLPAFFARYPNIQVVLSMTDRVVDLVDDSIDVAIRAGHLRDSSIRANRLGESRRVLCASPDYLLQHGEPTHPGDLQQHNCITFRDHPGHNLWKFRQQDKHFAVQVTGSFFARSADALSAAALAGIGIVLLPDWNLAAELQEQRLQELLHSYQSVPATTPIWALHTHNRHVPAKIRVFIDHLKEKISNLSTP